MEGIEAPAQPGPERSALGAGLPLAGLEILPLEQIEDDDTFRLRPEGDVAGLAQSLAREGQLLPVEVRLRGPGRWQLVTGFRRLAALRLLRRDKVLARLHDDLGDEEALALALADDLARRDVGRDEIEALRLRLRDQGRYGPAAQEVIERALGEAPPPPEPEEVDLDVFSRDLAARLEEISQDLASVYEAWRDVEPEVRAQIRAQLGYGRDLLPFLEDPALSQE
ncbi:MAG TPA: ParB N-terminal domain-containing protein [Myxococcales bacterium]|nr:ParB N-terminal domain-containing protein [Myxococcales bacterium]